MYDAILRVLLNHGKPGYTSRGHVAPKEEVAPSMAAEAMANHILGDQPLLLELRDEVSRSPTDPEDAVHLQLFFFTLLVISAAACMRTQMNNELHRFHAMQCNVFGRVCMYPKARLGRSLRMGRENLSVKSTPMDE